MSDAKNSGIQNAAPTRAYIITGPTSGIGRAAAFELANHGTVILVGRDQGRLNEVEQALERDGKRAVSVVGDLSDIASVRRAAADIVAMNLPIAGLLNNAGVMQTRPTTTASGWDTTFATNHLGPFAFTDALVPHLPDGAGVLFLCSAIENPEHKPAKVMGMRGGRFISVEASARGEWMPGGSKMPGMDAYATSKQCILASALAFARDTPRLRFNAVEPGINPSTGLGGANAFMRLLFGQIITRFPPFRHYRSTPEQAARVIARILTSQSVETGMYFDHKGIAMHGSSLAHDPKFQDRIVNETRAFLDAVRA
ncbi:SDR family NAD(P)-dependent oxidoreductase [Xanthobacter agilis]|uniref:NAD(P)-dependent dehydrogenase (Short-subunit alcohol dehydrogenase family) n=1 Tax=Xanthobacter agilis TaxID=47492 RepID=A0ABU0LAV9_XANAG|nr:SDR family NAD(P)-dependent oxidoreductase [Xanthobacter agilis]MDQ0504227.1 NAD(P)-dependent dehydrogenase (short-subunit alcohol dehydrogenase family) [Xanthobacter agilis]